MGVTRLVPVITRRTQGGTVNLERLRANAQEAAEQCGILQVPEIMPPVRLDDALQDWDGARRLLFCDETAETGMGVSELAAGIRTPLAVLIGPEGGFTPKKKMSSWRRPDGSDKPRSAHFAYRYGCVAALRWCNGWRVTGRVGRQMGLAVPAVPSYSKPPLLVETFELV